MDSSVEMTDERDNSVENLLAIRKQCEKEIIMQYDRTTILLGRDCWYIIDADWLNAWSRFVNGGPDEPEPGPLTSSGLLDDNGTPLPNLKAKIDYRGVSPLVYYIFEELHGKDSSYPDICRYTIDIYKPPVPVERIVNVSLRAINKAKLKVNKIRPRWMTWERQYEDDEEPSDAFCGGCCCGLSKEHLEAIIYWAIRCWRFGRKKSGRADISYRQYKPLRNDGDAMDEDEAAAGGAASDESKTAADAPTPKEAESSEPPKKINFFSTVRNHLTNMQPFKRTAANTGTSSNSSSSGGNYRTRGSRRSAPARPLADDEVDESDNDYEGHVGRADRGHESGTWLNSAVTSTVHSMNRN